jgi:hypothetical protein
VRINIPIWSRLTRVQRILLGVVVLIVVAFALAAGSSGREGEGSPDDAHHGVVGWLGGLFDGSTLVSRSALSGPCLPTSGPLEVDGSCTVHVAAGSGDVRKLKLRPRTPIVVRAPIPGQDRTGEQHVAANTEVDVAVNADATDVVLRCDGDSTCVVDLA